MRTIFRTGSQRRPPLSKAARLSQNQNGGHHQNASARRPSASRPRSAATAAQSREWTSPPRPRQSRSDVGVEPGEVHGYRRDLGVTATPTAVQARKEAAGWGWPPARLRASRRLSRLGATRPGRPRASGTRRGEHLHAATGQPPAPPNNTLPASRSRGQGSQVSG